MTDAFSIGAIASAIVVLGMTGGAALCWWLIERIELAKCDGCPRCSRWLK